MGDFWRRPRGGWFALGLFFGLWMLAADGYCQAMLMVQAAQKKVELKGYTRSQTRMTLAAEVAGKVLKVNYDVGDVIQKAPFLQIDTTFIDFQIQSTELSLENLLIAKARAGSNVTYRAKEFRRMDRLHKGDRATEVTRDAAAEQLDQARFELQSRKVELKTIQNQLAELKERRRRHTVMAPPGWYLIERMVEPGEIISAGTPLAKVADYTRLVVPLYVAAEELSAIQAKPAPFPVTLDKQTAKARLRWINPEFNETTRKRQIELSISEFQGAMIGGLTVRLSLSIAAQGFMVPKAAITSRYENPTIELKATGEKIPVVVVGENGGQVLIADHPHIQAGMVLSPAR